MSKKASTVCTLCPVTCELIVTFDENDAVVGETSDTGAQCESWVEFVEMNKELLLANAK
jgi:CxxC motif-containing protein